MSDEEIQQTLSKIGLELIDEFLIVIGESGKKQAKVKLKKIETISLKKGNVKLFRKILFWSSRLLSNNKNFYETETDDKLDYRYLYDLTIKQKDGILIKKYIRDFNLFTTSKAIEELNQNLEAIH